MIIASCYDTSPFDGFPRDKIRNHLMMALAAGELPDYELDKSRMFINTFERKLRDVYYLVSQKANHLDKVPPLKHPFVVEDNKTKRSLVFIDLRTILVQDRESLKYHIRGSAQTDYQMAKMRAALQRIWLDGHQIEMRGASTLPGVIFARWISSTLAQRYMLDPREQETIEIITGYYYYCLYSNADGKKLDAAEIDRVVSYMSRSMGMLSTRCYEVIDTIGARLDGAHSLCEAYTKVTESIRLKDFNVGHLYVAIGMGYFGMMGRELTALAVEHPPTWLMMLNFAIEDSMYRKSNIGTMMDKGGMRARADEYVPALHQLIDTFTMD